MKKTPTATATKKVVNVLATYTFKNQNRVCFTVLSSNGSDRYNTCFDNGKASCTCPAYGSSCYHIKQLAPRAQAIIEARETSASNARMFYCGI